LGVLDGDEAIGVVVGVEGGGVYLHGVVEEVALIAKEVGGAGDVGHAVGVGVVVLEVGAEDLGRGVLGQVEQGRGELRLRLLDVQVDPHKVRRGQVNDPILTHLAIDDVVVGVLGVDHHELGPLRELHEHPALGRKEVVEGAVFDLHVLKVLHVHPLQLFLEIHFCVLVVGGVGSQEL